MVILPILWILNHHKQLCVTISRAHLVEGRNTVTGEIVEMRKNASRANTNARIGTERNTGIVGMSESLWKDLSVWKALRETAIEWNV